MSYSYATAKDVLSDTEKNRLLAVYLSTDQPNVDWDAAAQAFGAANVSSMKALIRQTMKKVADAGGKTSVTAPSTVAESNDTQSKKARGGRKRKAEPANSDEEVATKPAVKKAAKKGTKKAAKAKVEEEDEDGDDGTLAWRLTRRQVKKEVEPEADVKDEEADVDPVADPDADMAAGEDAGEGAGEDAEDEETVV